MANLSRLKRPAIAVAALLAPLAAPLPGHAATVVSTIYGAYDAECGSNIDCTFGHTGYTVVSSGGTEYDNPSLFIVNQTAGAFTNATLTLTGYQSINTGNTVTLSLPSIAPHTVYDLQWGSPVSAVGDTQLFSYDYDDQFGGGLQDLPGCVQPYPYCTYVGNFDLAFAATSNGGPISSIFSPDNTQGGGNQAGTFVGFEGLDPNGLSETVFDDHIGSQPGVLANIYAGTNGVQVPEPASFALLASVAGMLFVARRRRLL